MKRRLYLSAFVGSLMLPAFGQAPPAQQSSVMDSRAVACAALLKPNAFANTQVQKAVRVAADAKSGMPTYCEVTALISPVPGSKITAVYRLPDDWNGRMLGLGGGGWAGNILLLPPRPNVLTASAGLPRGYAVAQTDAGHDPADAASTIWVRDNPVAVTDFGYRGIHETAVLGKQVVASYYGKPADRNYFQGCSTGGRMAMMETQRFPDDYDGVIAGAPVYSLLVQTSSVVRDQIFRATGAEVSIKLLKQVNAAVLAACDANDGIADGVVTNPQACKWDPSQMQCKSGEDPASCLTQPQIEALRAAYRTQRTRSGVVGNYGLARGSEAGWNPFVATVAAAPRTAINGALGDLVPLMFGDDGFYLTQFNIEKHQAAVHQTPFAKEYEASSTDLSRFFGHGGKLIMWHGVDDPGPSALATQDYYVRAAKRNGPDNLRYFAAPGVYHCGSGPGADQMDWLTALEQWVEKGKAPEQLTARNTKAGFERPLCAWPKLPRYVAGDPKSAASFSCQ
jgi:feruloyl esterase